MISYLIQQFNVIIACLTSCLEMVTWHYLASYVFITSSATLGHSSLIYLLHVTVGYLDSLVKYLRLARQMVKLTSLLTRAYQVVYRSLVDMFIFHHVNFSRPSTKHLACYVINYSVITLAKYWYNTLSSMVRY